MHHFVLGVRSLSAVIVLFIAGCSLIDEGTVEDWMWTPVTTTLNGVQQVSPVPTYARGTGKLYVTGQCRLKGEVYVEGMKPTAAHLHEGRMGENGPLIVGLEKIPDTAFAIPPGTRLTLARCETLRKGELYVTVRSATYPGGEIRGQLRVVPAPEPKVPIAQ